jgi:hypothetical protein
MLVLPPTIRVLASAASQVTLTGGVANTETILATITIPAGAMGINGRVRVTPLFGVNNNANTKRCRIRFGGLTGTIYSSNDLTTSTYLRTQVEIANRAAANSQVGAPNSITNAFGSSAGTLVTSAIDTSAAVDIVLTGTLVTANTDTITLESYLVELLTQTG